MQGENFQGVFHGNEEQADSLYYKGEYGEGYSHNSQNVDVFLFQGNKEILDGATCFLGLSGNGKLQKNSGEGKNSGKIGAAFGDVGPHAVPGKMLGGVEKGGKGRHWNKKGWDPGVALPLVGTDQVNQGDCQCCNSDEDCFVIEGCANVFQASAEIVVVAAGPPVYDGKGCGSDIQNQGKDDEHHGENSKGMELLAVFSNGFLGGKVLENINGFVLDLIQCHGSA